MSDVDDRGEQPVDLLTFRAESQLGHTLIAAAVTVLYLGIVGPHLTFWNTVLPWGDPYTYAIGFFELLDVAHADYWTGLRRAFTENWYWAYNVPIALLSPVLVKEPFSLAALPFAVFGLASAALFGLARQLRYSMSLAMVVALVPWMFPINFGMVEYSAVAVLGLDSLFMGLLFLEAATLLAWALAPFQWQRAALAGVSVGLAIWGRGNSLPTVGLVGCIPVLVLAYRLRQTRAIPWLSVAAFVLPAGSMTAAFFLSMGGAIAAYAGNYLDLVDYAWTWQGALPYLVNVPGFFFRPADGSTQTLILSCVVHLLVVGGLVFVWRTAGGDRRQALLAVGITGAFIYAATYLSMIALFTHPRNSLANAGYIYAPMRIGITLVVFAAAGALTSRGWLRLTRDITIPALVALVVYGVVLTRAQMPTQEPDVPRPATVEAVGRRAVEMAAGRGISMLWYEHYSPTLLTYYFRRHDADLPLYKGQYWALLWQDYDFSDDKRRKVREEVRDHFHQAGVIIIPEYVDHYGPRRYSLYRMRDEISRFLNAPESPRFVVRALVQDDKDVQLMVLQRATDAAGAGEALKLPYGPSTQPHADYGVKVVRFGP